MVVEASPFVLARDLPLAGQIREDLAQQIQSLGDSPGSRKGAIVFCAIVLHLADSVDARIGLLPGDLDVGIAFIVLEPDIVPGLVFLNQVAL